MVFLQFHPHVFQLHAVADHMAEGIGRLEPKQQVDVGQTQVGDARLLLMASLLVADKLSDAFDEIKQLLDIVRASAVELFESTADTCHQYLAVVRLIDETHMRIGNEQYAKSNKSFGATTLFRNVSFTVSEGDRIGLIGPNGSGKSTLLNMITGSFG